MNYRTAVITGASSGIGAATASRLAAGGLRVTLVARRLERLEQLAREIEQTGGQAEVIGADLSCEVDRLRLFEQVNRGNSAPDVLINNAGFGWYGLLEEMPWMTALEMVKINIEAVVHLSRLFLPGMCQRRQGYIINVGSIAGGLPSQGIAIYAGTKAFLDAFSTALYRELRGSGVYVSIVRPGPVATEFFDISGNLEKGQRIPVARWGIRPERVANRIWSLLHHPRRSVYVPWSLGIVPLVEQWFGWVMDLAGPIILKKNREATFHNRELN